MDSKEIENYKKAGKIAAETVSYAKSIVKRDVLLRELAEKIEAKIHELGGKPAFPVNLSINEVAAHYTPSHDDETKAHGLLKVDIGVHIEGYVADTAFSVDLESSESNRKLIEAAQSGLKAGVEKFVLGTELGKIGFAIERAIVELGVNPIVNLSGHRIKRFDLHAGENVPSYDNKDKRKIEIGVYAIEPFTTFGLGQVRDGKMSGIYHLIKASNVRDNFARQVIAWISEEYSSLPFCSRWIEKKFGSRGLVALRQIEQAGLLHHYSQLVEASNGIVAQAEHTVLIAKDNSVVTTR